MKYAAIAILLAMFVCGANSSTPIRVTQMPTTKRVTQLPTTKRVTQLPTTNRVTQLPTTKTPSTPTKAPTTPAPTTPAPTTPAPSTAKPTTAKPTTPKPKCGDMCQSGMLMAIAYIQEDGTCKIGSKPCCGACEYKWSPFGPCSKSCAGGVKTRTCLKYYNGKPTKQYVSYTKCLNLDNMGPSQICNTQLCPVPTTTTAAPSKCVGRCGSPVYKGDGYCDDSNNNCGCNWDGGDCCGKKKTNQFLYCKDCKCLDPSFTKGVCSGICGTALYKGDGFCDDNNNNCGCNWDGGDCCGSSGKANQFAYCSKCKCADSSFDPTKCPGKCLSPSYVGDGYCDDNNNNCGCKWDGGDCCGHSAKGQQYKYCKECKCMDPDAKPFAGCSKKGRCMAISLKGDGYCDDENNNCGCNWDGGDCCGYNGRKDQRRYCKQCKCLDPNYVDNGCTGFCGAASYKGDGFCDDNNNNCACQYDGGDCCGKSGKPQQFQYCKSCACKDPKKQAKPQPGQTCTGTCAAGGVYRGDGYCDDGNNNCGCEYDGGDCCGKTRSDQFKYCKACKCIDPTKVVAGCGSNAGGCGAGGAFKGDGFCDDANNNCACEYDGGDCCGKKSKTQYQYCKVCACKDPTVVGKNCKGTCAAGGAFKGDGVCDDANNNCGCEYDGGDCCGQNGNANQRTYCLECKCLDPTFKG